MKVILCFMRKTITGSFGRVKGFLGYEQDDRIQERAHSPEPRG
jgi:hypothetical protein